MEKGRVSFFILFKGQSQYYVLLEPKGCNGITKESRTGVDFGVDKWPSCCLGQLDGYHIRRRFNFILFCRLVLSADIRMAFEELQEIA